MVNVVF